jgi:DNA polymerase-1
MPDPQTDKPSLYLIDGHSLIYRAFFAIRNLSTSKGFPTNAIYGFTNMLMKLLREKHPDYLAVAFDAKGPTERHAEFEDYKAQRPEMPDALQRQIPEIHRIIYAFRIPSLMIEGYEADDLIGTVSTRAQNEGFNVVIVTGDKDLFQLIGPNVRIYDTMKEKTYEVRDVRERFGVEPGRVVEIMGLMGDSIDNIPGVPGVGEKTAVKLIAQFGTIENLLSRLDQVPQPKLRESLRRHSDLARMSRQLATLHLDCPVETDPTRFERPAPDARALVRLFQEFEFTALLKRLDEIEGTGREDREEAVSASKKEATPPAVEIINDEKSLSNWFGRVRRKNHILVQPWPEGNWLGMVCCTEDRAAYIPSGHRYLDAPTQLDPETVFRQTADILRDASVGKLGHDLKPLILGCLKRNLRVAGIAFDTAIASYLLNPSRRDHTLETAALEHLGVTAPPVPEFPRPEEAPVESVAADLSARGRAVFNLWTKLATQLKEQQLDSLFRDIEIPLIPVLAEMEANGIRLDVEGLRGFSKELEGQLQSMVERIHQLAGEKFNINSPKQLSKVLFEKLGLKPVRKTKTGFSTNEEVLQQLAPLHELPSEVLNYRQLTKLKSTYVDALPDLVDPGDGRLHTSFNQTATATGRLSSSDPNLQNIPIKGDLGKRLRGAFIAEEGFRLMSFDYNQIELRILAHVSGDERLIEDFRMGNDIHTSTAMKIFGLPAEGITSDMRRTAKTVNFGIVYGISAYGLSTTLQIPQDEAKRYIDSYFSHYQGVQSYIESVVREATDRGYVTTLFSRRRPIPELASRDRAVRGFGERTAVNTVIQGSAADLIKLAMIRIAERLRNQASETRLLLQIHDELLFEVPHSEISRTEELVKREMEGVQTLRVPLKVEAKIGSDWGEI